MNVYNEILPTTMSYGLNLNDSVLYDDLTRILGDRLASFDIPKLLKNITSKKHSMTSLGLQVVDTESDLFYFVSSERSESPDFLSHLIQVINTYENQALCDYWWYRLSEEEKITVINETDVLLTAHLIKNDCSLNFDNITPLKLAELLTNFRGNFLPPQIAERFIHEQWYHSYGSISLFTHHAGFSLSNEELWFPSLLKNRECQFFELDELINKLSVSYQLQCLEKFLLPKIAFFEKNMSLLFKTPFIQYYVAFHVPDWGHYHGVVIPKEYLEPWTLLHSLGIPLSQHYMKISENIETPIILE